jgi:Zn-dependent metalloprotease
MRSVLSIIIALIFGTVSAAEPKIIKKVELESTKIERAFIKEGLPIPIYLTINEDQSLSLADFWEFFKEEFQLDDSYSYVLVREESDDLGFQHLFFRQAFKGNLIYPAQVHLKLKNKEVVSYSGKSYNNLNEGTIELKEKEALDLALKDFSAQEYKWQNIKEEKLM